MGGSGVGGGGGGEGEGRGGDGVGGCGGGDGGGGDGDGGGGEGAGMTSCETWGVPTHCTDGASGPALASMSLDAISRAARRSSAAGGHQPGRMMDTIGQSGSWIWTLT